MAQPQRVLAGAFEMRVDGVCKDHLLLLRHAPAEIHADVPVARRLARELDAHVVIVRQRHEVRGVAPEFFEGEWLAVRQLHHQRRVDVIEKALHRVAHEDDALSLPLLILGAAVKSLFPVVSVLDHEIE